MCGCLLSTHLQVYQRRQALAELSALSPANRRLALAGLLPPEHPSAAALAALPLLLGPAALLQAHLPAEGEGAGGALPGRHAADAAPGGGSNGSGPGGPLIDLPPPADAGMDDGDDADGGPQGLGSQQQQEAASYEGGGPGGRGRGSAAAVQAARTEAALVPATASEVEVLLGRVAAIARAAGDR